MAGEGSSALENRGWLYHPVYPDDWERSPLYSLAQWVNGIAFRDIQFTPSGMPVIKIAEIKGGISGQTKFTEQVFDESVRVRPGDLLFSWSGQPETSIDAFWWRGPEGWLNQHVFRVTPADGIDRTFFYYLLRYLKPNFVGIARNKQTTGLGHVTKRDLENIEGAYPKLAEQRAIAHILGTLDDKIELNRRMSETLEAMARALFKSWFVDFDPVRAKMEGRDPGLPQPLADLFPDSFEDSELGEIPEGWDAGCVDDEFDLTMGQSPPGHTYNEVGDGVPFYQGRTDFGFRFPTRRVYCTAPTRLAKKGDTLISVRAPVGDINMVAEDCAIGRGVAAARHKTGSRSYSYQFMRALEDVFRRFEAEGTVFGSIGKKDFHAIACVAPPRSLVEEFERRAAPLDSRIELVERESRTLAALRDALLPKLISGELRVKDAERMVGRAEA
jgi:type I restriction enzyme S subunit